MRRARAGRYVQTTAVVVRWADGDEVRHDIGAIARVTGQSPAVVLRNLTEGERAGFLRRRVSTEPGVIRYDATLPRGAE